MEMLNLLLAVVTINPSLLIEFGMLGVAVVAIFIKVSNSNKQQSQRINDSSLAINLKINNNTLKIIELEKDLADIKLNHEKNVAKFVQEFNKIVEKLEEGNKREHEKFADKIEVAVKSLTQVSTALQMHLDHSSYKSPRDQKRR